MYYRRKILLSLLQLFGGKLQYTRLQKYLFLVTRMQDEPVYDFVPYKYGPFSFQSYADIRALIKRGFLTRSVRVDSEKNPNYYEELNPADKDILDAIRDEYSQISYSELIRYTYKNFPEYTVNSEILESYLSTNEIQGLQKSKSQNNAQCLFTLGYEGISIDTFINRLLQHEINVLIDVRKNAMSMKYGFSKSQLIRLLGKFDIAYVHLPQLGINSSKRKRLNSRSDYERLFKEYESNELSENVEYVSIIRDMLGEKKRVALMCFESEPEMCHRHKITELLESNPNWETQILHL